MTYTSQAYTTQLLNTFTAHCMCPPCAVYHWCLLHDLWGYQLCALYPWISTTVPGFLHTALLEACIGVLCQTFTVQPLTAKLAWS
jgi:hypothetical protein